MAIKTDRLLQFRLCLLEMSLIEEQTAAIIVCDRRTRVEIDCFRKLSQGRFDLKVVRKRDPKIQMILKIIRPGCYHLAEHPDTALALAFARLDLR